MKRYMLEIVVFLCGASVMILELLGSRVLAPYVGTSLYIWSTLIGIILGCLSFGYWFGGRIADVKATHAGLASIIFAAGTYIGGMVMVKDPVLVWITNIIPHVTTTAIVATIVLFAIPGVLLGMVSPYTVKLKMDSLKHSGQTVGNLYALSTLGSIVGTFAAGFFLLPLLGNAILIWSIAVGLVLLSLLVDIPKLWAIRIGVLLVLLGYVGWNQYQMTQAEATGRIERDTMYNRVVINEGVDPFTGRPIRLLITAKNLVQSAMYLDGDNEQVAWYTRFYRLADLFVPDQQRVLMIGGGAYSYPKEYVRTHTSSTMDVVEIDPGMTALAQQYFLLESSPRMNIFHEDGRMYLNTNKQMYDVIFIDAFTTYSPPYELTTLESVQKMREQLRPGGAVLMNIISSIEGETGKLVRAEYATYKAVFPHVTLFAVQNILDPAMVQNIMLVASNEPMPQVIPEQFAPYVANRYDKEVARDVPVLTDDHAPVDQYMLTLFE